MLKAVQVMVKWWYALANLLIIFVSLQSINYFDKMNTFAALDFDLKQHHHALADAEACAHIALELFKIDDDSY